MSVSYLRMKEREAKACENGRNQLLDGLIIIPGTFLIVHGSSRPPPPNQYLTCCLHKVLNPTLYKSTELYVPLKGGYI